MKFTRSLLLCVAVIVTWSPSSSSAAEKSAPARVFRAGSATSNITPPLGLEIVGNFAPRPIAAHVHDELHVRCLVLDDGTTKLAFAVADIISLPREIWDEAKKRLEEQTGIPASNMMFSGTHTHSSVAPVVRNDPSLHYRQFVINRVVDGVRRAINNLEPARIAWGAGKLPQWVYNRRFLLKDNQTIVNPFGGQDRAIMNPGGAIRSRLLKPAGPTNPEVYCLSVQATDGRQIALLANYWLHYVGGVPREHLSADYFGEFCRQIERTFKTDHEGPACVGILANGPCGDVNSTNRMPGAPEKTYAPYEKIKIVAGDLAAEVLRVHRNMKHQDWVPLKAAVEELELATRRPTPEMIKHAEEVIARPKDAQSVHRLEGAYASRILALRDTPAKVSTIMQAFRIGDLAVAAIPFEVFTETGLEIKKRSPFADTFTIELANGSNGYLPTPPQHDLGGYETWLSTNRVERDASTKITEKILSLIERLR